MNRFNLRTPHCLSALAAITLLGGLTGCPQNRQRKAQKRVEKKHEADWNLTDVVVAKVDIAPGMILTEEMVTTDKIPAKFRKVSMVIPKELDTILGNEVVFKIMKGDYIAWNELRGRDSSEDRLSKRVTKNGRGVPITLTTPGGVVRKIKKSDHVDVIGVFPDPTTGKTVSMTLLQNIIVMESEPSSYRIIQGKQKKTLRRIPVGPHSLMLLVLPEEAETLALVQKIGRFHVALRNPEEIKIVGNIKHTTAAQILQPEHHKKLQEQRYRTIQRIKIIRGMPGLKK